MKLLAIRSWGFYVNQWGAWQRFLLLLVSVAMLFTAWYVFLEKPLRVNYGLVLGEQVRAQETLKELNMLMQLQSNFIYKNDIKPVQLKQVFKNALSGTNGLTISNFTNDPAVPLQAGGAQFSSLTGVLGISFLSMIIKSPATVVFSGGFNDFLSYLKILQSNPSIYFERIDFNMNRYPKAAVTMQVFTLGG